MLAKTLIFNKKTCTWKVKINKETNKLARSLFVRCAHCEQSVRVETGLGEYPTIFCSITCQNKGSIKNKKRISPTLATVKPHKKLRGRSHREAEFFNSLQELYPQLKILANNRTILDGLEIDVYIPELKVGIEWNGVVHFKPIYGMEKLLEVRGRDQKKLQLAVEKNIHLIVITDVGTKNFVTQQLNEVKSIIDCLLTLKKQKA